MTKLEIGSEDIGYIVDFLLLDNDLLIVLISIEYDIMLFISFKEQFGLSHQ